MHLILWGIFSLLSALCFASVTQFLAESAKSTTMRNSGVVVYRNPSQRNKALWAAIICGAMAAAMLIVIRADLDMFD